MPSLVLSHSQLGCVLKPPVKPLLHGPGAAAHGPAAATRSSCRRSLKPQPLAQAAAAARSSHRHSLKPLPLAQAAAARSSRCHSLNESHSHSLKLLPLTQAAAARSNCRRSLKLPPLAQASRSSHSRPISCDLMRSRYISRMLVDCNGSRYYVLCLYMMRLEPCNGLVICKATPQTTLPPLKGRGR